LEICKIESDTIGQDSAVLGALQKVLSAVTVTAPETQKVESASIAVMSSWSRITNLRDKYFELLKLMKKEVKEHEDSSKIIVDKFHSVLEDVQARLVTVRLPLNKTTKTFKYDSISYRYVCFHADVHLPG
jgi:hypothetical protein